MVTVCGLSVVLASSTSCAAREVRTSTVLDPPVAPGDSPRGGRVTVIGSTVCDWPNTKFGVLFIDEPSRSVRITAPLV